MSPAPSESAPDSPLLGRATELGQIDELVERRGGSLLVSGEPGIGKSSLIAEAQVRAAARGFQVLFTAGTQTEADLPFAGLHRLLRPILAHAGELPPPQRESLEAAFGMSDGSGGDRFLVGLATLSLLTAAAEDGPVLLIAEDAHWLDRATVGVLGFVARRIEHDPVVLLAAARDGSGGHVLELGLPELRAVALDADDALALVTAAAPALTDAERDTVLAHAAGNPLAIVELPLALRHGLAPDETDVVPVTARLERAFAARVGDLPGPTQELLLVAAVDDGVDPSEIVHAATVVLGGDAGDALNPAIDAGLIGVADATLTFRHPLVRSAIYHRAPASKRRAAHAALAQVLTGDRDRRIVHRAAATLGTDDDLADQLDAAAELAERRGAPLAASEMLERSARFTRSPSKAVERLLDAARVAFELGDPGRVQRLLARVRRNELTALQQGRLEYLAEIFRDEGSGDAARVRELVGHAEQAAWAGDADLALELLSGAALRSFWADPGEAARMRVVEAAAPLPVEPSDPRLLLVLSLADPIGQAPVVAERLNELTEEQLEVPDAARLYGGAAQGVGDEQAVIRLLTPATDALRRQGRLALLAQAQCVLGAGAAMCGEFVIARPALEEGIRLSRETSQPVWVAGPGSVLALVQAARGDHAAVASLVAESERIAGPLRLSTILSWIQNAKGLDALGDGRYDDAWRELVRMFTPGAASFNLRHLQSAIASFADAALHTGRRDEARSVLERLGLLDNPEPAPTLRMGLRYARPVLADDSEAEAAFRVALGPESSDWPFDRARLHLNYGMWLRRQRRVVESRDALRAARDGFDRLGAVPWAERARRELRAAGETSATRATWSWDRLTAQELQIARHAADGESNAEIGAQLFISPHTVAYHLRKVFPKLGITSRRQLARALASGPDAA